MMIYKNVYSKPKLTTDLGDYYKKLEERQGEIYTMLIPQIQYVTSDADFRFRDYFWRWIQDTRREITHSDEPKYKTFTIPKRSGGMRTIEAPNDMLKERHRKLLNYLTKKSVLASNNAHGFTTNRNCKTALQVHQKAQSRWFLHMDIHDFFNSTKKEQFDILKNVYPFNNVPTWGQLWDNFWDAICSDDHIPQGSPLSPLICNMVLTPFDCIVDKFCKTQGLTYTRYADDIIISSPYKWEYEETVNYVDKALAKFGYELKREKTHFGSFNGRNWNLGIMFNNEYKLTVGHEKKHQLKKELYEMFKDPTQKPSVSEVYSLLGKISYARYIEPDYAWFSTAIDKLIQEVKR